MQKPNWFDTEFEGTLKQASAEQALAEIAKQPKIVKAVKDALSNYDANSKKPGWAGPSRTQAVRKALAEVIQADA
jgi:hypothetical protein